METMEKTKELTEKQKASMRVRIAKDVLKQLNMKRITADAGCYLDFIDGYGDTLKDMDRSCEFKDYLPKHCNVCALGSMFLSNVKFNDKLTIGQMQPDLYRRGLGGSVVKQNLETYFDRKQMAFIEVAFEVDTGFSSGHLDDDESAKALKFGKKYLHEDNYTFEQSQKDTTKRLVKIMENIIRHKGTFKP